MVVISSDGDIGEDDSNADSQWCSCYGCLDSDDDSDDVVKMMVNVMVKMVMIMVMKMVIMW